MVNWQRPLLTLTRLILGGKLTGPTVVRLMLQPPIVPCSKRSSSMTKRDQVPFGSMPTMLERSTGYGASGAGAGNGSAGGKSVGRYVPETIWPFSGRSSELD